MAPWSDSRGPDRFRSQYRRLRLAATGRSSAGGAVLGHVVRTDVDGIGGGLFHELDAGSLGMGFGDYFDNQLLPDAKPLEDAAKDFIVGDGAEDGAEVIETVAQVL